MKVNAATDVLDAVNSPASDEKSKVEVVTIGGVSVRIRPTNKDGTTRFVLDYRVKGQRKLVWRSTMAKARVAAKAAIEKIAEGQGEVLNLKSADAYAYTRARASLAGIEKEIDIVAMEYAEGYRLLKGKASVLEACRYWLSRNDIPLPHVSVTDAVSEFKLQCLADGKSKVRRKEIQTVMDNFATAFNVEV